MSKVKCPTCGTHCAVNNGAEGTGSFIPADEEIERLTAERDELAASINELRQAVIERRMQEILASSDVCYSAARVHAEDWFMRFFGVPAQAVRHIQAQGMQMAADICRDATIDGHAKPDMHPSTSLACAKAIEAAKKELEGE